MTKEKIAKNAGVLAKDEEDGVRDEGRDEAGTKPGQSEDEVGAKENGKNDVSVINFEEDTKPGRRTVVIE